MKCFNHREQDAVAACKHCGKGLCHECMVEAQGGASCRGVCEDEVAATYLLLQRAKTVYLKTSKMQLRNCIFLVVLGAVFCVYGLMEEDLPLQIFFGAIGTIFMLWGVFIWRGAKEFKRV
jgi:hypothetical protein